MAKLHLPGRRAEHDRDDDPATRVPSPEEVGPDHEKEFEVMVSVDAYERYGKGRNKKDAEQAAARYLLDHLQG